MTHPLLQLDSIDKSFFGVPVLKGVKLALDRGSVLGLVGENGAGKSTLMNIVGGVLPPDAGTMTLAGQAYAPDSPARALRNGVALIHQELNLFPNLTVAENLCLSDFPAFGHVWIDRRRMRQRASEALRQVEAHLSPDALVAELSPGQRQLVEIAKGLQASARLLVLDEPTTSLSEPECERLFGLINSLRAQGMGFIYISHNLGHVLRLCDQILVLRDGEVQTAAPAREFTVEKIVTLMVGRRIEKLFPQRTSQPRTEIALEARDISQRGSLSRISFALRRGEVLGISGMMGAGRTELMRVLFGLEPMSSGHLFLEGRPLRPTPPACLRRGLALVTEDRREEGLLMNAPLGANMVLASLARFVQRYTRLFDGRRADASVAQAAQRVSLVCHDRTLQPVRTLSGGNQQKVVLGKWLLTEPRVFLLDEPTRGVDVGAKAELYQLMTDLAEQGAAVLVVSSELEELLGLCDRILIMRAGEICGEMTREQFHREDILKVALGEGQSA